MITLSDYRLAFSEHDSVDDADVQSCIDDANDDVNGEFLGNKFKRALLFYAAHNVQLDYVSVNRSQPVTLGSLRKKTVGPITLEYESVATENNTLINSTWYGQKYMSLVSTMFGPVSY